ncbi:MAG: type II secretion system F family protein [Candidatus Gracilibacteria bacterium]|nr:type II secretion system F family protein [Candidatus Gracilibacteria bacterium]
MSNISLIQKINESLVGMQSIKVKEKLIFYRLLATMTNAGMSLVKSIQVLGEQEKNPVMKSLLGVFVVELKGGKTLSECLEIYPNSFDESEVGIISSGEKTGKLNTVLLDLANQMEKISSISSKLKSAMIYPAFIVLVVFAVIGIMMVEVVPKLLEIFEDKEALPSSTKTLIAVSDFLSAYWSILIVLVVVFVIFIKVWKKTAGGKYLFDKFMLKIPIFGGLNQKLILSKFSRLLSGLISSGVSIVGAFDIVATGVGNEVYRQRILLIREDIQQGIKIWESIDGDKLFPTMMVQMIKVGEETANIDSTILKVADFYDEQVDNLITTLNKLLEPIIIVFLAVAVGSIAMAIMQPIMNLADTVSGG